jgi:hypothetical protein
MYTNITPTHRTNNIHPLVVSPGYISGMRSIKNSMSRNPKTEASKAVRYFLSQIGRKGGLAGKGSPAVKEKMRKATAARLAKRDLAKNN